MRTSAGPLTIALMTEPVADAIATWSYEPPYDFYDASADDNDLAELLDPALRRDWYYSARSESGELVGYFVFKHDRGVVDVGLGLRPDLTGRGLGELFLEEGLAYARRQFAPRLFRLSVATFNERAITVYERAGFVLTRTFLHETNGGLFPFVEMERHA